MTGEKIKVFIIDDHPVIIHGIKTLLHSTPGITVVGEAGQGGTARKLLRKIRPDIIIVDLSLPDVSGIELTRKLLAENPARKIIVLSMHSQKEYIIDSFQAGAQGFVSKESATGDIVTAINAVQAGEKFLPGKMEKDLLSAVLDGSLAKDRPAPRPPLSRREQEIMRLTADGGSVREMAEKLKLSPKSVYTYRSRLMKKLAVKNIAALLKFAVQHGLADEGRNSNQ